MAQPHKSHKPKLEDVHRAFLVREMACFSGPAEAAEALKEVFDVEITPQAAQHYDELAAQVKTPQPADN